MIQRARAWLSRLRHRDGPTPEGVKPPAAPRCWHEELADAGQEPSEWIGRRLHRDALYVNVDDSRLARLRADHPRLAQATLGAAERVLRHEFDLLGSGSYTPHDPRRQPAATDYRPIDWSLDPVSGIRFPHVPLADWNFNTMRPRGADIKFPWELTRCQHWPTLGQAYRLTGDHRFAIEIAHQLRDFMEANPVDTAVHWACTMDVGLRAVNWTIGLELIRPCQAIPREFWQEAYKALFDHGTFIENHLEDRKTYGVASNHFLSNVIGLFFLAAVFDDLPKGAAWDRQSRAWLAHEMDLQVLPDGADFESSVPYHRLVTELFLGAARLADFRGRPFPKRMLGRVRTMVDFISAVQRPDGLMPQVGDADDGRLHILSGYGGWQPQDARHLFGPAACMFQKGEWASTGGESGHWESVWWGLEPADVPPLTPIVRDGVRHFPNSGLTVLRYRTDYLLVTNGIVGTDGFGNHKHNDLLGFEYHVSGVPVLVDPGSYIYTPDPPTRNAFRSTRSHNTVSVDGEEQNELRPNELFRMFEKANPEMLEARDQPSGLRYRGRHHGYTRLTEPVVHERTFTMSRLDRALTVTDSLRGRGRHRLRWHFHFAPDVQLSLEGPGGFTIRTPAGLLHLTAPETLQAVIGAAWYSPSYGVRIPCTCLDFEIETIIGHRNEFVFRFSS